MYNWKYSVTDEKPTIILEDENKNILVTGVHLTKDNNDWYCKYFYALGDTPIQFIVDAITPEEARYKMNEQVHKINDELISHYTNLNAMLPTINQLKDNTEWNEGE